MGFLVFFIKRALATIPLLFAITVVAFTLLQAMPGDYADQWKNQTMMHYMKFIFYSPVN